MSDILSKLDHTYDGTELKAIDHYEGACKDCFYYNVSNSCVDSNCIKMANGIAEVIFVKK